MAIGNALNGKPYAGNPHVRFDEGEVASCTAEASLRRVHCRRQPEGCASVCAATPRRESLLYNRLYFIVLAIAVFPVVGCGDGGSFSPVKGGGASDTAVADSRKCVTEERTDSPTNAQIHLVITDFVREVVDEAEDARVIFTDGILDEEIREESRRRSLRLQPFSLVGRNAAALGFMENMTNGSAVAQMGFESFKRNGVSVSPVGFSGVIYRHCGMSDSMRTKGIDFADRLAKRILDLHAENVVDSLEDEELKRKFLSVQWRIARIARARGEQERRHGLTDQSRRSMAIAEKLDACNPALKRIRRDVAVLREKAEAGMSQQERLKCALARADFDGALAPAREILKAAPEDLSANFAMAMWHYRRKRWSDAEKYLRRCKDSRPTDVAVLNNLAMVCLYAGRLDEARNHAREALLLKPDSADVKDTLAQIEAAIERRRK